MGGEDFSAYCAGARRVLLGRRGQRGPPLPHHHPRFIIDESAFRPGIAVFVRTALDALR